jgi:tetratricopeptide (TPR) repeat protein
MIACVAAWIAAVPVAVLASPDAEIAALVARLGDEQPAVRELASERLAELGTAAADELLRAAESSDDLELALRARWLVDRMPLAGSADPPRVSEILGRFPKLGVAERIRPMHVLLRLDDNVGIEPLGRIVRLDRSAATAAIAAALLAREWTPGDRFWPPVATAIERGIGPSNRAPAAFLRGLVRGSRATTAEDRRAAADDAAAALAVIAAPDDGPEAPGLADAGDPEEPLVDAAATTRIFRRSLILLRLAASQREEAVAEAGRLFEATRGGDEQDVAAVDLVWLADHGLPEAVELVADRVTDGAPPARPLVAYAAAVARRRLGDDVAAEDLAARAHAAFDGSDVPASSRLQAAMLLARWGAVEWSLAEHAAILDDAETSVGMLALSATISAEFLNEHDRCVEAAAVLRELLDGPGRREGIDQALMQIARDPNGVRSRMLYFEARAAALAGDPAGERRLLEESLEAHDQDVDTLIALYRLAGRDEARLAAVRPRIAKAIANIRDAIAAVPDDATAYNELAWLVANTEGDVAEATACSRKTLELSFDSPGFLDTLAHCQAAAGDLERAIRTQSLAVRREPHNRMLRRNLERFEARAAATP